MRFQSTHFTRDQNDGKHVFVFGSNLAGRHGKGAALEARNKWGAETHCGIGLMINPRGMSYAIPTKGFELEILGVGDIDHYVKQFIQCAKAHENFTFLVTRIGCGLAGYRDEQIAWMFRGAPYNCVFQSEWEPYL